MDVTHIGVWVVNNDCWKVNYDESLLILIKNIRYLQLTNILFDVLKVDKFKYDPNGRNTWGCDLTFREYKYWFILLIVMRIWS